MTRLRFLTLALAIGGLVAVMPLVYAQAPAAPVAQPQDHQAHQPAAGQAAGENTQMRDMHREMMADMNAMDARLDALIIKMNTATGEAKIDAIADALTAMVQQHRTMRDGMMQMHGQMTMPMRGQMMMPMGGPR